MLEKSIKQLNRVSLGLGLVLGYTETGMDKLFELLVWISDLTLEISHSKISVMDRVSADGIQDCRIPAASNLQFGSGR